MKKELDEKLCADYPKLFVDRHGDMRTTCMVWGFECGDGWYNIIDQLCGNIQHHLDWKEKNIASAIKHNNMIDSLQAGDDTLFLASYGTYNADYVETCREDFGPAKLREIPEAVHQVTVTQVKEKFGTLRFYYSGGDDAISGMVRMAESMSSVTCEECGTPGRRRGGGWVRTLCDTHAEARGIFTTAEDDAGV